MKADYQRLLASSIQDRRDLFILVARKLGIAEQNVEKDFWVCWALAALFENRPKAAPRLLFKGGTSLSKAFGLIQRFSEDIDITIFREDIDAPISIEELEALSGKKRRAKLEEIQAACQLYLREELCPELADLLADSVQSPTDAKVEMDNRDPDGQTILVHYQSVFSADPYVRPVVRLECGAKSALDPHDLFSIKPYVSDELSGFNLKLDAVTTIYPERTFWDKIVIAHGLRGWFDQRAELRQEGQRISRHYYDLHTILSTPTGTHALANRALGRECVRHASMFFGRPDLNLKAAAAGRFAIVPYEAMLDGLRRDYNAMSGMIFGPVPSFDAVMASIIRLQAKLHES